MGQPQMQAKFVVIGVEPFGNDEEKEVKSERIQFSAVSGSDPYGPDGESDDNTYARFTPQATCTMLINNPELIGMHKVGEKYYVAFTKADDTPATAEV